MEHKIFKKVNESWKNVCKRAKRAWINWGREATQKCLEGVLSALGLLFIFVFVALWPCFYVWSLLFPKAMAELCDDNLIGAFVMRFNTLTIRCLPRYAKEAFIANGINCFTPKQQVKYYRRFPEFIKYFDRSAKAYLWAHGKTEDKLQLIENGYILTDCQFKEMLLYYNFYEVVMAYTNKRTLSADMIRAILNQIKELILTPFNGCVGELEGIFLNYARKNDLTRQIQEEAKEIQDQNFQSIFKECVEIREQIKIIREDKNNREVFYPWCHQNMIYPEAQRNLNLMQLQAFLASGQTLSPMALQEFVRLAERQEYQQLLMCFFESSQKLTDEMIDIVRTSSYAMKVRARVAAAKNE